MKKLLLCFVLLTGAMFASATPTGDFQAGVDFQLHFVGGSYSLNVGGTQSSGIIPDAEGVSVSKQANSLNGSFNVYGFGGTHAFGLATNSAFSLVGSVQPNNTIRFAVNAPTMIGKTVSFTLGQSNVSMSITNVAGTFNLVATSLGKPQLEGGFPVKNRDTGLASDPLLSNGVTFTGTVNGVAATLSISHLKISGLGGLNAANFVKQVTVTSSPSFINLVQGGTSAKITITLANPVSVKTTVKLAYNGTGISGPSAVSVLAGSQTTTASLATLATSTAKPFAVRASLGNYYDNSDLCTVVPALAYFTYSPVVSASPLQITAAMPCLGTVRTITPVAANTVVSLYCSNPNVSIPATVTIPSGGKQASFAIKSQWVSSPAPMNISGIVGNNAVAWSTVLLVPGAQQVGSKRP